MEDFNNKVEHFRAQYKNKEKSTIVRIRLGDIVRFMVFEEDSFKETVGMDFYVKRDNKIKEYVQIECERPENLEAYYGRRINRLGFNPNYIAAILRSSYVYKEYDFCSRNVSVTSLKDIMIPYVSLSIQMEFDKMMTYTKTEDYIQNRFFENVLDWMVVEIFNQKLFRYQNVNLIEKSKILKNLRDVRVEERAEFISKTYQRIIQGDGGG